MAPLAAPLSLWASQTSRAEQIRPGLPLPPPFLPGSRLVNKRQNQRQPTEEGQHAEPSTEHVHFGAPVPCQLPFRRPGLIQ
ncbi:hypothetical protein EYF80_030751 [Liparis tanakae]|uniref:Uncharacterized protein n=1 Tax=Liparis tanakae TaxID=230148 RepID=A0A4Z2H1Q3_9TELE|nr:hypothetical protein EYF80_030751 [Liparis tanakae]